jgi:hypothetical protein
MPDLASLLHNYADQLTPAPTPALDTVQRTRLRRRSVRVGSAAMALIVTATLALTWLGAPSRRATPADGVPAHLVIDGITLDRAASTAIVEVQAASATATTLTVDAGSRNHEPPTPCEPWTDARVLSETDTTVTVAATLYEDRTPLPAGEGCALPGYPPQRLTLALRAPLGARTVIQDDTRLPVRLLNTLLLPFSLPAGYDSPVTNDVTVPSAYKGTITRYTGPGPNTTLEVFETPLGSLSAYGGHTVGHSTVRGHTAGIFQDGSAPYRRCVRWDETSTTSIQVCSQGNPAPLTVNQLSVVAESLSTR